MATAPLASSAENTNGAKLSRLLIDGGTTVLRSVFDHHHAPANLAVDLNSSYSVLINLFHRRFLNRHQWDKLFPPGGVAPDSKTFDITLLFLLLTNICGLSPPLTGWHTKPPPSDISIEANLARVKYFRNELYGHVTSTGIDTPNFSTLWLEISTVLVDLGLDQAEVDKLKAERCGEEDYLGVLMNWADSEDDIKSQLKDIRDFQAKTEQTVKKVHETQLRLLKAVRDNTSKLEDVRETNTGTYEVLEKVAKSQIKGSQILRDNEGKIDEIIQMSNTTRQAIKEAHKESISRLEEVSHSQTQTQQAVDDVQESIEEVKKEVENLKRIRDIDPVDKLMKNLAKSEFRGDVEYHARKFQEGTREWIFKSVDNWLNDRSTPNRVMVISGNAGTGKTVISAVISQRMQEAGRLSGSHFCQNNNARYRNPQLMLQSLACHLSKSMPKYKEALVKQLSRNLGKDIDNMGVEELFALLFKEPLSTVDDPGRNILIVIDGLDESEYKGRNELLDVIGNHFCKLPAWIRILITTRPERNIAMALQHLKPIQLEQNKEENLKDIRVLFEMQLKDKIGEPHKDVLLRELVGKSEGLFLYAYYLIDFIQENVSFLTPSLLGSILPSGISFVYLSYFRRLEKELRSELKVEEEHVLRFLCALTASREPLPIEFVSKVLNPDGETLTTQRRVNKAIACFSTLLPICEGRLYFFHKSVKDWLTDTSFYGQHDFTADEKEGHRILFNLCTTELDSIKRKGIHNTQFSNAERYALQHSVQHMVEANRLGERSKPYSDAEELMKQYVTDVELVYAKLCVNSTVASNDLLTVQTHVNPTLVSEQTYSILISLLNILRKHSYVLRDHPHLFFQSLLNEGGPKLSSRAAWILESRVPMIPYMKYLDKKEQIGADQARFYCSDAIACFDVSPELDLMVCECRDATIHLWSLQTGNREWVRPSLTKREFYRGDPSGSAYRRINNCLSFYRSVVFHPSGQSVLPGTLQHVYTLTGEWEDLFPDSDCTFSNCAFSGNKEVILTDSPDEPKRIALWNMENGKQLSRVDWKEEISSFAISQDGSLIAFSVLNGDIFLVDPVKGSIWYLTRCTDRVCGLMHFTSNNNTLVCGLLCLTSEQVYGSAYTFVFTSKPRFIVFTPLKDLSQSSPQLTPVKSRTFVLWPSDPKALTEVDLMEQTLSSSWVNNVQRVIPFLSAGSYIRLSDETVLIGSPACNYLSMVNVGLLKEGTDSDTASDTDSITDSDTTRALYKDVRKVVFSIEGDTVYSISSKDIVQSSSEVVVTVWRMSRQTILVQKIFYGSLALFPAKEGVVLFRNHESAELWDFELSKRIRLLTTLAKGNEFKDPIAISDELIACWFRAFPNESLDLVDNSSQPDISTELLDLRDSVDSSKLVKPPELHNSDDKSEIHDSSKLHCTSKELDVSSEFNDSLKLDDSSKFNDPSMLGESLNLSGYELLLAALSRKPVLIGIFNVTSGEFVSSMVTSIDSNEYVLSISCNNQCQLLVCTEKEIPKQPWIEKTTLSLRTNGFVMWERSTEWCFSGCVNPQMMFSPQNEFVVTWKILDTGHGLHILDSKTGETLHVFLKHDNDIVDCKFLDCGSLVCCSGDNFLRLFNVKTGHLVTLLDIGQRPFSLGTCLHHPLVAIGLKETKVKFIQVHLPTEAQKNKG